MESDDQWAAAHADLQTFAPRIRAFLRGDTEHPRWTPEAATDGTPVWPKEKDRTRLAKFELLQCGKSGRPDMLLYALGKLHTLDPGFAERLSVFMALRDHVVLVNASASGKTRMLFEALCNTWGLYFTCYRDQGTSPYGSYDLSKHIRHLKHGELTNRNGSFQKDLETNLASVRRMCMALVTAHLLVFNLVLDMVSELGIPTRQAQHLWLLLQLRPDVILNDRYDLFSRLYDRVETIDIPALETNLHNLISSGKTAVQLVAVDEANVAMGIYPKSFALSDGHTLAPLLNPLVRALASALPDARLVVSGTEVNVAIVEDAIRSSTSTRSQVVPYHRLGAFDSIVKTQRYVEHFLGRNTSAHQIRQIHSWFQGRHRWLANYVENILRFGPARADAIIQMTVLTLTGYEIGNTDDYMPALYGILIHNDFLDAYPNPQQLRVALFTYALKGQVSTVTTAAWKAVATSLGTFGSSINDAVIWEPLVFYRLFTYIQSSKYHGIARLLERRRGLMGGPLIMQSIDCVAGLAAYLYRFFQLPTPESSPRWGSSTPSPSLPVSPNLSDILTFVAPAPYWASGRAHLVLPACCRNDGIALRRPERHSITAARGPEDVRRWLVDGQDTFMIPDAAMGVDLLFFIQLEHPAALPDSVLLVSLQVDRVPTVDRPRRRPTIVAAGRSSIYSKAQKHRTAVVAAVKTLPTVHHDILHRIPIGFNMLRILCDAEPYSKPQLREPPVATLQLTALVRGGHEPELDVSHLKKQQHLCLSLGDLVSVAV